MKGALLVAGTTSDAGKSVLVAGLCRMLARRGVRVAPFKAQNMSNNSVVTLDGGEIGRAQAMQAAACGLEPSVRFNPVLLKPGSDRTSQLVVRGRAVAQVSASNYIEHRQALRHVVADELSSLRAEFDVVICEGAGSPAEINLRATDLANMGLARAASLPVIVVGDIDRGGVLAHLFGTVAVLSPEDQALVAGFVINKFRGDPALLAPGLDQLRTLTGRPTYGVVPFADGLWMDAEDSLGTVPDAPVGRPRPPLGSQWLRVAAVRLPRISNTTDVEALACEPGVSVHWVTEPSRLEDADLVVVPGSKSTVSDLEWLRRTGLARALSERAAAGMPVLGICGGYQMLGRTISDSVESGVGTVEGLGLLDLDIEFAAEKVLMQVSGRSVAFGSDPVRGYEIHHGRVVRNGDDALLTTAGGVGEGSVRGGVVGTHWHGLLESDDFRRSFLAWVAVKAGRAGFEVASDTSVAALREQQLDLLADLVDSNIDIDAVLDLIENGVDGSTRKIVTQML
ncbi:cobyric acid synthase CobQ [Rhodococcus sp. 06-221-2]|uniref:cobyric acid synthase n=1 Tax=Rhodococcus sp. 06-221-2 TaxID=2022514 RepID=UPI000B9C3972|nr:cobyric acid synthase [Rhodococcus sp. 06-221-2]MBX5330059.1 cobyric acid synthase [Rhodococcus fascians]MBY4058363.1 cobyric acid synthase [Rhodococcus fascians]MBY4067215.1 cobyric acid synthase [Rhodococcus fascians]OZC98890.1 cobyric acid synthase CobQ [Rhodococcus sp. 06-221-2]